jgi:formylmethanofuran dehydrogenase subunit E
MTTIIEEQIDDPNKECEQCGERTGDVKRRNGAQVCKACYEEMQREEPDWIIANF